MSHEPGADRGVQPHERAEGRAVVIVQAMIIALLLLTAALVASTAHAATSTIGRTWPIVEPDAMAEIETKVATLPRDLPNRFGPRSSWTAMRAASLGPVSQDRVRAVVPFYTLDFDITLPDGRLLYPKGYSFNPLAFVSLPQRLVIVHPRDLGWALKVAQPTDWILLTASDRAGVDVIDLSEKTGRPLYILEERVKERLGLTVAPVIVRQLGQKLELTEVRLVHDGASQTGHAAR